MAAQGSGQCAQRLRSVATSVLASHVDKKIWVLYPVSRGTSRANTATSKVRPEDAKLGPRATFSTCDTSRSKSCATVLPHVRFVYLKRQSYSVGNGVGGGLGDGDGFRVGMGVGMGEGTGVGWAVGCGVGR